MQLSPNSKPSTYPPKSAKILLTCYTQTELKTRCKTLSPSIAALSFAVLGACDPRRCCSTRSSFPIAPPSVNWRKSLMLRNIFVAMCTKSGSQDTIYRPRKAFWHRSFLFLPASCPTSSGYMWITFIPVKAPQNGTRAHQTYRSPSRCHISRSILISQYSSPPSPESRFCTLDGPNSAPLLNSHEYFMASRTWSSSSANPSAGSP